MGVDPFRSVGVVTATIAGYHAVHNRFEHISSSSQVTGITPATPVVIRV
jgi:hypothetical protein